jgi:hypothetical protein
MQTLDKHSLDELLVIKEVIKRDILSKIDPADINVEIDTTYIDDSLCCADALVNKVPMEFLWYKQLGFLYYYKESKQAFNDLKQAIVKVEELIDDIIFDKKHEANSTN